MDAVIPRLIAGQGTPEAQWHAWFSSKPLPVATAAELLAQIDRVVIVAPHPDDEVLVTVGFLRHCTDTGTPCLVVAVTDGEASHPESALWSQEQLARTRAQESAAALAILAPAAQVLRLGLPDGHVTQRATQLAQALHGLLRPSDALLCPWRNDGHPDHEATGHTCASVARQVGCRLFELPIWTWHWAAPEDLQVPWHRAGAIALSPGQLALKTQALACFRSQLLPDASTGKQAILPAWATKRLLRPFEVVFL